MYSIDRFAYAQHFAAILPCQRIEDGAARMVEPTIIAI
jgi:hypothetical protein